MYRDHVTAASGGYGGDCHCGGGKEESGIPDVAALAAGAIGAFLIYQAITMAAAGKRKKRDNEKLSPFEIAKDILFAGEIDRFLALFEENTLSQIKKMRTQN